MTIHADVRRIALEEAANICLDMGVIEAMDGEEGSAAMVRAIERFQYLCASAIRKAAGSTPNELRPRLAEDLSWRPIATAPKRRKVLAAYKNPLGNWRTVIAKYFPPNTLESEYDEGEFANEGWYEFAENQEVIMPVEGEITHWMPLPQNPDAIV